MFSWYPQYEPLIAQIQLVLLMVGMGTSLQVKDFIEVLSKPRSFIAAFLGQVLITPFLALGINHLFDLQGGVAVGLILVSAMPGGALSKLFTYLGRGNIPLSITLSAFTTLSSLLFVPLWLNLLTAEYVPEGFSVPADRVIADVALFLVLPVIVGMVIGRRLPAHKDRIGRICVRLGLLVVAVMIIGSLGSGRITPDEHGLMLPLAIILFCLASQQINQIPFYLFRWPRADRMSAGIEVTMRNINLALLINAEFFQGTSLGGGVLFVLLFYAAVAMFAGVPLVLRNRRLAKREGVAISGND